MESKIQERKSLEPTNDRAGMKLCKELQAFALKIPAGGRTQHLLHQIKVEQNVPAHAQGLWGCCRGHVVQRRGAAAHRGCRNINGHTDREREREEKRSE